ncbi:uncharacterized protein DUF4350 [Microbacterium sp. SLBN-154]|uniref:DUF4350 domain-containing protein n=1 Tax=Microbacterium sp. SLBN-154 TaxID=2768458 RepID=UPI001151C665|nr:DUF4350 domain-containing protein [Microbacterium sp. SLBN-154]TQK19030.1 uncharacterized protein DUF4350 [Microbacterium sp. SLBN-154]
MTAAASPTDTGVAGPAAPRRRRVGGWIVLAVALLVVGAVGALLSGLGEWAQRDALDAESAGPTGTRALVEVLRDQGVAVEVARTRADATRALDGAADGVTLVLPDTPALSDDGLADLAAPADDIVLIEPRSRTLRLFLPGTTVGGRADTLLDPQCGVAGAERSGPVAPGAVFEAGDGAEACYLTGDGAAGLIVAELDGRRVAALDGAAVLVNEVLAQDGNAALGINLLARHPLVVWYDPMLGDTDLDNTDPSLGESTPRWVSPAIALLLLAAAAAAIWRGRRFGPLVRERLPVTVRAAETAEGRARLYAQTRDAAHAADDLRIAALRRMARLVGLGPNAAADEISDATADRLSADRRVVRGILLDDVPTDDAQLAVVAARLRELEAALRDAVRPERNRP